MLKTIFMDIDDTIFDFQRAEACALREMFRQLGIPSEDATVARYSAINAALWRQLEEGKVTREHVLTHRFVQLFAEFGITVPPAKRANCMSICWESSVSSSPAHARRSAPSRLRTTSISPQTASRRSKTAALHAPGLHLTSKALSFPSASVIINRTLLFLTIALRQSPVFPAKRPSLSATA